MIAALYSTVHTQAKDHCCLTVITTVIVTEESLPGYMIGHHIENESLTIDETGPVPLGGFSGAPSGLV